MKLTRDELHARYRRTAKVRAHQAKVDRLCAAIAAAADRCVLTTLDSDHQRQGLACLDNALDAFVDAVERVE